MGYLGASSHSAFALSSTSETLPASPARSGASTSSMCGSEEGCCIPIVALPSLMARTTFRSSGGEGNKAKRINV